MKVKAKDDDDEEWRNQPEEILNLFNCQWA
jgi:hypothetical protein